MVIRSKEWPIDIGRTLVCIVIQFCFRNRNTRVVAPGWISSIRNLGISFPSNSHTSTKHSRIYTHHIIPLPSPNIISFPFLSGQNVIFINKTQPIVHVYQHNNARLMTNVFNSLDPFTWYMFKGLLAGNIIHYNNTLQNVRQYHITKFLYKWHTLQAASICNTKALWSCTV